jgi:hypothetical protein
MSLHIFINYCFDFDFKFQYLKPFNISNYAQKLINELENSIYEKNEDKKIL